MFMIGKNLKHVPIHLILGLAIASGLSVKPLGKAIPDTHKNYFAMIVAQFSGISKALMDGSTYKNLFKDFKKNPAYPFAKIYLGFFQNDKIAYGLLVSMFAIISIALIGLIINRNKLDHFSSSSKLLQGTYYTLFLSFIMGLPSLLSFIYPPEEMKKNHSEFLKCCGKLYSGYVFLAIFSAFLIFLIFYALMNLKWLFKDIGILVPFIIILLVSLGYSLLAPIGNLFASSPILFFSAMGFITILGVGSLIHRIRKRIYQYTK